MLAQTMPLVAAMQADPLPAAVSIPCPAQQLPPQKRQELALQVLDGSQPVAQLARQHQVSRQFLYRQADTAQLALDHAFDPPPAAQEVLFHLPVTTSWLRQLILTLVLACHSPYRGVIALLRDLFDTETSLGTVHNVVQAAVARARGSTTRTTWPPSASEPMTRSSRPATRSWWVLTPPPRSATS